MTRRLTFDTPGARPPVEIIEAFESSMIEHVRRVEIFEADGTTSWRGADQSIPRLVGGNVSVDYNSAERRKLDLLLDNKDLALRPDSMTGLWYDKVIKVYRGIRFKGSLVTPRSAVVQAPTASDARSFARILAASGLTDAEIHSSAAVGALDGIGYIAAFTRTSALSNHAVLKDLWNKGKNIITVGVGTNATQIPLYTSMTNVVRQWGVAPTSMDSPVAGRFSASPVGGVSVGGNYPTGYADGTTVLSVYPSAIDPQVTTATLGTSAGGGYWLDIRVPEFDNVQVQKLIQAATQFMRGYSEVVEWEMPMGEFLVDNISEQHFPKQIKITGRDFTKKLMQYKMQRSGVFAVGTRVKELVEYLAANAGIPHAKHLVGIDNNEVLETEMSFAAGTPSWDIIKNACDAFGYEVYFDSFGNFTVREFRDPSTSSAAWTFKTGFEENPDGANLVSYDRSISDSRIYNWITVVASPSESETGIPFFGEAKNDQPQSPTSIGRLGPRMENYETNWLTSDAACQEFAMNMLKIAALESYDFNFSSIFYPWLEAGEVIEALDPDRTDAEPTRFLLDSISYPIDLGPMSGTAKRVTYVGSSGN